LKGLIKMKIIDQSCEIISSTPGLEIVIEHAGRTCYQSWSNASDAEVFVKRIKGLGHLSVLEHGAITVRFVTDRGVTHELVRHRLASYSQESTRYCNYGDSEHIIFIRPVWVTEDDLDEVVVGMFTGEDVLCRSTREWVYACIHSEGSYSILLREGWSPQQARQVLNNSVKTEIVMTANPREWLHVFELRTSNRAHPQMRALMSDCLKLFQEQWPAIFGFGGEA
jgi:thymidylate synthase (FAD)